LDAALAVEAAVEEAVEGAVEEAVAIECAGAAGVAVGAPGCQNLVRGIQGLGFRVLCWGAWEHNAQRCTTGGGDHGKICVGRVTHASKDRII
jgi:hypothetical protein